MYKKILEKKFRGSAEATDSLDDTGWKYVGRRGLFRKYHLYIGVSIDCAGKVSDEYEVRLFSDGYIELLCNSSISGTISTTALPARVHPSKQIYDHLSSTISDLNAKLANDHGHHYFLQWEGHKKFAIYELETHVDGFGKSIKKPCVAAFTAPVPAYEWAVSKLSKKAAP